MGVNLKKLDPMQREGDAEKSLLEESKKLTKGSIQFIPTQVNEREKWMGERWP